MQFKALIQFDSMYCFYSGSIQFGAVHYTSVVLKQLKAFKSKFNSFFYPTRLPSMLSNNSIKYQSNLKAIDETPSTQKKIELN
jgi:hypothetical protein